MRPGSSSMGHMKALLNKLGMVKGANKTDMGAVFNTLAEHFRHRGLIVIISDLFDRPDAILKGLRHFGHKKHDVIVFHVMDEYEMTFPFQRMTLFEGLEEYPKLLVDPRSLRKAYLEEVTRFCEEIRKGCVRQQVDYVRITTDQQLDVELTKYLASRLALRGKRG